MLQILKFKSKLGTLYPHHPIRTKNLFFSPKFQNPTQEQFKILYVPNWNSISYWKNEEGRRDLTSQSLIFPPEVRRFNTRVYKASQSLAGKKTFISGKI